MRPLHASLLATLAIASRVHAQVEDVAPGANREGVVHVSAIKSPEMHSYRAIEAGMDTFDDEHALAPDAPLLFAARTRGGAPLQDAALTATLSADAFRLDLPVDGAARFTVPRSRQARDADAELVLSRKRRDVRVWPYVRTPGLADDRVRLGDLRLQCKVFVTIAKKEAPFWAVALGNTGFMTTDWCSAFKNMERTWSEHAPAPLAAATLREGDRAQVLTVKGNEYLLPLGDASWGNDALIELEFAPTTAAAPAAAAGAAP